MNPASLFPNGVSQYAVGGALIGLGVALLYVTTGRPGGVSTFFSAAWSWLIRMPFFRQESFLESRQWRLVYALGLVLGGALYVALGLPLEASHLPAWKLALGGLFIGFGARLGGGCTSGHGICGMASLSVGSMAMVITFLATGIATAWLVKGLGL
ncbi:MAG TPA: YeeE/YedE thiosulfate transporter family protein [Rhodocyclaceae bacterium]|nr:YeeE/YedE thiosulfate transporter family protein [Rhodocyclaceae bacterium]